MKKIPQNYQRELAIHRYIQALERGDLDGVGEVLDAALHDPELDRIITEINLAYHQEEQLNSLPVDLSIWRLLRHRES